MQPPAPFPSPPSGTGYASPARAAADLARQLTGHGITSIYTATAEKLAVISVAAGLTVWTNGQLFWCTLGGQRRTWSATETGTAAVTLAALARPAASDA